MEKRASGPDPGLPAVLVGSWRTNCRVTAFLVEQIPSMLWDAPAPGIPRRSIRSIAAHLHNIRCRWIKTLGREHGIRVPPLVNRAAVTRRQLGSALKQSGKGIEALLELGLAAGGRVPDSKGYVSHLLPLTSHLTPTLPLTASISLAAS